MSYLKIIMVLLILNAMFSTIFANGLDKETSSFLGIEDQERKLTVKFVDPQWDGKTVPLVGICTLCGGEGKSPELNISNIPDSANVIIVEFNDRDYYPLSENGGHGAISVSCEGKKKVIIPPIPEQTFEIPEAVKVEHGHRAPKGKRGAYLGPCSCGYGNHYFAVIKAINRQTNNVDDKVLEQTTINLGKH